MPQHRPSNLPAKSQSSATLPRPLRWKVVGTARDGQLIEIFSARLTIGSGPECTLRLRSKGVGSLQCLIVREARGPVARSLSLDTLLNGQRFRQEVLHAGDRLKLGSIELELCDDGLAMMPTQNRSPAPRLESKTALSPWLESKSQRPIEVLARIERLEEKLEQLRDTERTSSSRTEGNNLDSLPTYQDSCSDAVPATHAQTSVANDESAAERERLLLQLERSNQQHEQAQIEFARLQAEREALQLRCDELAESHQAVKDSLQSLQAELARQATASQAALDDQRRHLESKQSSIIQEAQQFQDVIAELVLKQAAANEMLTQLDETLSEERQHRGDLELKLSQQADKVAALQAQCDSLNASMLVKPVQQPTAISPNSDHASASQPENDSPDKEHEALDIRATIHRREQRDWLAQQVQQVEAQFEVSGDSSSYSTPTELPTADCKIENEPAPFDVSVTYGAPLESPQVNDVEPLIAARADQPAGVEESEADVFSRLSRAGIWKAAHDQETTPPDHAFEAESDLTDIKSNFLSQPSSVDVANDSSEAAVNGTQVPGGKLAFEPTELTEEKTSHSVRVPGTEDGMVSNAASEDSIEAYMQQLLQRVRGDSGPSTTSLQSFSPDPDRNPQTEVVLPNLNQDSLMQGAVLTESEYQPRSQAPEMGANFAAMRAIGNDSRKKNILKHAERTWTDKTRTRLFGSVGGLAIAFASFFYLDTHPEYAAIGLFTGFSIAGFWLWQAFHFRKKLVNSLRLNLEEIAPVQDETEVTESSPEAVHL